jgi:hypothetical protein
MAGDEVKKVRNVLPTTVPSGSAFHFSVVISFLGGVSCTSVSAGAAYD